jgi:biotin carboxyl carrier protein
MATTLTLRHGEREFTVTIVDGGTVRVGTEDVSVRLQSDGSLRIAGMDGRAGWAVSSGDTRWVYIDGRLFEFAAVRQRARRPRGAGHHESLAAPMPATVRKINVSVGDRIQRGDTLIVLEAMKMELPVKAESAGTVEAIRCREGDLVQPGVPLIDMATGEATEHVREP